MPYAGDDPPAYQWQSYSPSYITMNAQASKTFNRWNIYAGVENLGNFYQKQLIIDAENPFSNHFDASMVWGPTFGRMLYAGFRYVMK